MSQPVGQVFKSRIPTLGDDASIQEALRVYHYGVDNYSVQAIPEDSIEGNFRSLDTRLDSVEATLSGGLTGFIRFISLSSAPNIVTGQTTSTVPLTVRAVASQSVAVQQWENSSSSPVARVSAGGYISTISYIGIGTLSDTSAVAANINVINSSHKGIVVKGASSQTANLQEWQNSGGTALSVINNIGSFSSAGYASLGSSIISTTTTLSTNILNSSHKGITVKAFSGQSANLQEWQDFGGLSLVLINNIGEIRSTQSIYSDKEIYSMGDTVQTMNPLLLIGS